MTDSTPFVVRKLHFILHRSYVELRMLAQGQHNQRAFDLADAFELIPQLMDHLDDTALRRIRELLCYYHEKHPDSASDFPALFDLDEAAFHELTKPWGEAALDRQPTDAA